MVLAQDGNHVGVIHLRERLICRLAQVARAAGLLIAEVNGVPSPAHPIAPYLVTAGFVPSAMGFMMRRAPAAVPGFTLDLSSEDESEPAEDEDTLAQGTTKRHA